LRRGAGPFRVPDPVGPVAPRAQRPTLGVMIAAYQGASIIGEAIESVLAQTLPADEIVVCDDGSTDDLEAALAQYGDRLVVIRKQNGGGASALNVAAKAARSEFVVQLDQDDAFAPERLEAIADLATARPDLDVIATDAVMELDGEPVGTWEEKHDFEVRDQRAGIMRTCFFGWPAIRRARLVAAGGFDENLRIAWDWDCWIRLILGGSRVGLVDRPLYRWRFGHDSLSSNAAKTTREVAMMLEQVLERDALTPEEREIAREVIALNAHRAALLGAKEALATRRPGARRLALSVVTGTGFSLRTRAKAGLAALVPGLARRFRTEDVPAGPAGAARLADR